MKDGGYSGTEAIYFVASLINLYQKIALNRSIIQLRDITDYLVNNYKGEVQSQTLNAKFIGKSSEMDPPELIGFSSAYLNRLDDKLEIIDLQTKNQIMQVIHSSTMLFVLTQFKDSVLLFKQWVIQREIKPTNQEPGNYITYINYAHKQQRLGAVMRNHSIIFWDKRDDFHFQLVIGNSTQIESLIYLQLQDTWVTTGKCINIWNLSQGTFNMLKHPLLEKGVIQIAEIHHLNMTLVAVLPNIISCWDFFDAKFLFKFTTSHQNVHQIKYSRQFQILFCIGFDTKIDCYQIHNQYHDSNLLCQFIGHSTTVTSIELVEKTAMLASIDSKNTLILWDIRKKEQYQKVQLATRIMTKQLFSYNNCMGVITTKMQYLKFEDIVVNPTNRILCMMIDSWENLGYICTRQDIRVQDLNTGNIKYILAGIKLYYIDFDTEITCGILIEKGTLIVLGLINGDVIKVSPKNGEIIETYTRIQSCAVFCIEYDEINKILHILGADQTLKALAFIPLNVRKDTNAKDKRALRQLLHNNSIQHAHFSIHHGLMAVSFDNFVQIINLEYYSVVIQIQLEDDLQITSLYFCETVPLLLVSTSGGDVYFIQVHHHNEHYLCTIEGQVNIVKAVLLKKLGISNKDRKQVVDNLFSLTSQTLIDIYAEENSDIQIKKLDENKYKMEVHGTFVTTMRVVKQNLLLGTNNGTIQQYSLQKLLSKTSLASEKNTNYNPYRVIYHSFEEHFIENYKIVQGRLMKDLNFKVSMKTDSKIKAKFRMSFVKLNILRQLKGNIEPDITEGSNCVEYIEDQLIQYQKFHDDSILNLNSFNIDHFKELFESDVIYIISSSKDNIKILTDKLHTRCHFILNNTVAIQWTIHRTDKYKQRAQLAYALQLIEEVKDGLSLEQQLNYDIEMIAKQAYIKDLKVRKQKQQAKFFQQKLLRNQQPKFTTKGLIHDQLPLLNQETVSLRYHSEKQKIINQQEAIRHQERMNELNLIKRNLAISNEETKKRQREITDFLTPHGEEVKLKQQLHEMFGSDRSLHQTHRSDHAKRLNTDSTRHTVDFFDYAESKEITFKKIFSTTARSKHQQFHKIINSLDGKLKFHKGK